MADTDLPRESGTAETAQCPTCGADLTVSTQADGGKAAETCANCHTQPSETAEQHPLPLVREQGTEVESGTADYNDDDDNEEDDRG